MGRRRRSPWVPILMYHRVVPTISEADPFQNCITVRSFASHLAWLRRCGYTSVDLDAVASAIDDPERAGRLPARPVAITLDDGYRDNHDFAWPVLARYGFKATIFLVSSAIGMDNGFDRANVPVSVPMLSNDEIRRMHRAGIDFGSHTRTHPDLGVVAPDRAHDEIHGSRSDIESILQAPVHHFSYPYARTHARLEALVRKAGYRSACAGVGTAFEPFRLSRVFAIQRSGSGLLVQMGIRRAKVLARRAARRTGREVSVRDGLTA